MGTVMEETKDLLNCIRLHYLDLYIEIFSQISYYRCYRLIATSSMLTFYLLLLLYYNIQTKKLFYK